MFRREDLVTCIAEQIALFEGFGLTNTIARRYCNPGNLRSYLDYPTTAPDLDKPNSKYVNFLKKWEGDSSRALFDGTLALVQLIGEYIDGVHTQGKSPTLEQFFSVYAPTADNNLPANYAHFVAGRLGISADVPLNTLIDPSL